MNSEDAPDGNPSRLRSAARRAFNALAWAFLAAIVVQVFFAGAGIFSDGLYLARHVRFVEWFQPIPLLLLVAAFVGRLARFLKVAPAIAFVGIVLQYEFVNASPSIVAGFHTVNALVIFWLAVEMVRRAPAWNAGSDHAGPRP